MRIYDRQYKSFYTEKEYKASILKRMYTIPVLEFITKHVIIKTWFSKIMSMYYKSSLSKHKINQFINEYNIRMPDIVPDKMNSFNDFFTRRRIINRYDIDKNALIAPCDGKLSVYRINNNTELKIKGHKYKIFELLKDNTYNDEFNNGYALVYRLTVDDCHRYNFIDSGYFLKTYKIDGVLHTVRNYSKKYKIYKENKREVSILQTENFGKIAVIEIGALLVGDIVNNGVYEFKKNWEKGHFEYGGSTVVILLKDINNLVIDRDIEYMSNKHIETKVSMGETVGRLIKQ